MDVPIRPKTVLRRVLPNGCVVLALQDRSSPTVAVRILLPHAGAAADGTDAAGRARFAAAILPRGTEGDSAGAPAEGLDGMGASLQGSAGREAAERAPRALAEDVRRLLDLCGEVLIHPAFPEDEVERLRGEIVTSLRVLGKDPRTAAQWTLGRLLYPPPHPFGIPAEGIEETVVRLQRPDLVEFWHRHYGPQGAIVAVVGDIEPEEALDAVAARFDRWQVPSLEPLPDPGDPPRPPAVVREVVTIEGKVQADVAVGVPGVRRSDPDYLPLRVGNLILGEMGLMGRIGDVVRERKGLAYYALSVLTAGKWGGPWYAIAGVPPERVREAAEAMVEEFTRMRDEGPTPEELLDAIQNRIGWLQVSFEGGPAKAQLLTYTEFHGRGRVHRVGLPVRVRGVTREDRVEAVGRRCPGPCADAAAGAGGITP